MVRKTEILLRKPFFHDGPSKKCAYYSYIFLQINSQNIREISIQLKVNLADK